MKSWKARVLILATMLAMLIALAAPAVAHDADFEEARAVCLWLGYEPDDDDFWDCVEAYLAWHDDDEDSADEGSADEGSGDAGSGYSWQPYYWDPDWLSYY